MLRHVRASAIEARRSTAIAAILPVASAPSLPADPFRMRFLADSVSIPRSPSTVLLCAITYLRSLCLPRLRFRATVVPDMARRPAQLYAQQFLLSASAYMAVSPAQDVRLRRAGRPSAWHSVRFAFGRCHAKSVPARLAVRSIPNSYRVTAVTD